MGGKRLLFLYRFAYVLLARSRDLKRLFHQTVLTIPLLILSSLITMFFPLTAFASVIFPATSTQGPFGLIRACAIPTGEDVACRALIVDRAVAEPTLSGSLNPNANQTKGSAPYIPDDLHNAYNLPKTAAGTPTIAIVDAFNNPNAESDLAVYRAKFGLPPCTTANGCFHKVNQMGGTFPYPLNNAGWGVEIALDLDMASAICQNCHILLVEANTTTMMDLGTAVNTAVRLGATVVSNSYGSSGESSKESTICDKYYTHNNVAVTASSGDSGPAVGFPAVCPHVVAVGGTTLNSDGSETTWNTSSSEGAGGGCSTLIGKPSWEDSGQTACDKRAVSDVAAVADPQTGVYIYDTYKQKGWLQVGGTSASAPIIAGVYALAGHVGNTTDPASLPWQNQSNNCSLCCAFWFRHYVCIPVRSGHAKWP